MKMKKNLSLVFVLAIILAVVAACGGKNEVGNSTGNIVNVGIAAIKDDLIYFVNANDDYKLYTMRTDGSDKTLLFDEALVDNVTINIVEDLILLSVPNNPIYTIKTDGNDFKILTDDSVEMVSVVGDNIFYTSMYQDDEQKIYSMKIDGSGKKSLSADTGVESLNVVGDRLYYCYSSKDSSWAPYIYTMKTDGSGRQRLSSDGSAFIVVVGDRIYYINYFDDDKIYSIKTDGSDRRKVTEDRVNFYYWGGFNVANDWIYYSNYEDDCLYRIKTDGSNRQKITDDDAHYINIVGNWLIYEAYNSNSDNCTVLINLSTLPSLPSLPALPIAEPTQAPAVAATPAPKPAASAQTPAPESPAALTRLWALLWRLGQLAAPAATATPTLEPTQAPLSEPTAAPAHTPESSVATGQAASGAIETDASNIDVGVSRPLEPTPATTPMSEPTPVPTPEPTLTPAPHVYEIWNADVSWLEARQRCEDMGGHLATIGSREEEDKIIALIEESSAKYIWLGGYTGYDSNGVLRGAWITGEPFDYENWTENEPSGSDTDGTSENCLMMWHLKDYDRWTWNDQRNNPLAVLPYFAGNIGYVCEYE
ncbi:MAG: DUF5050 domain-containing protein [Clostridiales bacterium]|jgi:hypothetical protein|nr:DUF5050 domain-containing protein [Clostridiales bacterium]